MIYKAQLEISDISGAGADLGSVMLAPDTFPRKGDVIGIHESDPEVYYEVVRVLWFTSVADPEKGLGTLNPLAIEVIPWKDQ